ncbi:hypothetical protein AB0C77_29635 [Streptomyces sp. NPDC048629]|uniref:hypothetical protein n=1 Tax=Streptomyces sp. NPDC048629 TaxID=3154824 RepID=UPI00342C5C14
MPQEQDQHPFEEELGAVMHRTGDSFSAAALPDLASRGLSRGRRRLARRRAGAVGGSVLALALVAVGGAYGGGLLGGNGPERVDQSSVGAGGRAENASGQASAAPDKGGKGLREAQIPVRDLAEILRTNTPAGTWSFENLDGTGQSVLGVFDDGKGKAGVSVGLYRAGEGREAGADQVSCPNEEFVPYDACTSTRLADGARLMVLQGYEYPDRRVDTKAWRAVLLTKDGFLIDASEYNAAAEKDAPISRPNPPFSPAQLKTLVTAEAWRPLLKQLPEPVKPAPGSGGAYQPPATPSGKDVQATLRSLLPKGLRVTSKGGEGEFGYVVVDDGKGKSLVQINVQPDMGDVADQLYTGSGVTTLPNGTKVKLEKKPGEKGGAGVVWWTADTMRKDGFRVVVSAFNAGAQHEAATREEPALTLEQLKGIALSPKWEALPRTVQQ